MSFGFSYSTDFSAQNIERTLYGSEFDLYETGIFVRRMKLLVPGVHNISNALAAIYLATGQDAACVVENSSGVMSYEYIDDSLYVTLTMPSITVGTVGGACRLPTQKRNLQLLGCHGENSSKKLAEIICAATLALEISLTGAISSHEFSDAHLSHGRNSQKVRKEELVC